MGNQPSNLLPDLNRNPNYAADFQPNSSSSIIFIDDDINATSGMGSYEHPIIIDDEEDNKKDHEQLVYSQTKVTKMDVGEENKTDRSSLPSVSNSDPVGKVGAEVGDAGGVEDEEDAEVEYEEVEVDMEVDEEEEEKNTGELQDSAIKTTDVDESMKSTARGSNIGSGSSTPEKSEGRPPLTSEASDLKLCEDSYQPVTTPKESYDRPSSSKELALTEDNGDSKGDDRYGREIADKRSVINHAKLCREIIIAGPTNPSSNQKAGMAISSADKGHTHDMANGVVSSANKQIDLKLDDNGKGTSTRLAARNTRVRSRSPATEKMNNSKRHCVYYARGWCIKGSLCKFSHTNGTAGDKKTADEEARMLVRHYGGSTSTPSIKRDQTLFTSNSKQFPSSKHENYNSTPMIAKGSTPLLRNSVVPEHMSSLGVSRILASNHHSGNPSSISNLEEGTRHSHLCFNRSTPITSLLATSITPPQNNSVLTRSLYNGLFPRSGPETGNNSLKSCKTNFSFDDWEPSEPFRPSFTIPLDLVQSLGLLAPPDVPILNPSHHIAGPDPSEAETPALKSSDGNNSSSIQSTVDSSMRKKNSFALEPNGTVPNEETSVVPEDKSKTSSDRRLQSNESRSKTDLSTEKQKQESNVDFDYKSDAGGQKENKEIRHLRAVLIERVKELLRPAWRGGFITKETHNLIVKKSVDKVISTVQSQKNLSTIEAVEQYMSYSQQKVAKLVAGYVEKYKKS